MVAGGVKLLSNAAFNPTCLKFLVCPLSKKPLRYSHETKELISDYLGVAYPIVNGIPCLSPTKGRILDNAAEGGADTLTAK